MDTGVIISSVLTVIIAVVGLLQGYHLRYLTRSEARALEREQEKEKLRKAELEAALNTGKGWVCRLEGDVNTLEDKFASLEASYTKLEKDVRVVQSQIMTESKVDSKLQPIYKKIEDSVAHTSSELREMKAQNKHLETMLMQVSGQLNRVVGFLEAKKEGDK